ncbi:sugar phosphate isomerase/epimerase [Candidatus Woesearchaeota archaeon]|nr:sugar phosphate isomerase/epimerase [Candidatus Woesearchaeota archaeon]
MIKMADYTHSMDRAHGGQDSYTPVDITPRELGANVNPFVQPREGLKARIFEGLSKIEFEFMGAGKGNSQSFTPETFGALERKELRELAHLNEMETTTHASPNAGAISGFTQNGFNDQASERSIKELKKAIDFAGEASTGGAVVFHIGEWIRPISTHTSFEGFEGEKNKELYTLADEETGQLINISRDQKFYLAKEKDGKVEHDDKGLVAVEELRFDDVYKKALADEEFKKNNPDYKSLSQQAIVLRFAHFDPELKTARGRAVRYAKWAEKNGSAQGSPFEIGEEEAIGAAQQYEKLKTQVGRWRSVEEIGLKKTAQAMSKTAMHTRAVYQKNKSHLKKQLYLAPEAFMPEQYGSHPDEFEKIINKSREEFARRLHDDKGLSTEQASKEAAQYIKGTIDIGHMNQWRQYYKAKEPQKSDQEFDKWLVGKFSKLAEKGFVGHVHLSDNFGYDDEHITPGEGNAPIKAFVKAMKEASKKSGTDIDFIMETGPFNPTTAWSDTLAHFDSPVFGVSRKMPPVDGFGQIHDSYFGKTKSANYIVGDYAPSERFRGAPFYSGLPLE